MYGINKYTSGIESTYSCPKKSGVKYWLIAKRPKTQGNAKSNINSKTLIVRLRISSRFPSANKKEIRDIIKTDSEFTSVVISVTSFKAVSK